MDKTQMIEYLKQNHNTDLHQDYLAYVNSFDSFELQTIQLNSVNTDLCELDQSKLVEYSKLDFNSSPPIVVGNGYIIDGYHRVNVALGSNKTEINAWVGVYG